MTDFKFTISRSAISAAYRILNDQDLVTDSDDTEMSRVAIELDEALRRAETSEFEEVLDSNNPDVTTYLAKLRLVGGAPLIGVLTELRSPAHGKWAGSSNKILVTVKTLVSTGEKIRTGRWKSMTGRAIFARNLPYGGACGQLLGLAQPVVPDAPATTTFSTCTECQVEFPATSEYFYLVRGKFRKQCKGCYKRLRNAYRAGRVPEDIQTTLRQLFTTEDEQVRALAETRARIATALK